MTSALYDLVWNRQWQAAITHIQSIADGNAADQLFHLKVNGWSAVWHHDRLSLLGATGTLSADDKEGQAQLEEEVPAVHHQQRWVDGLLATTATPPLPLSSS